MMDLFMSGCNNMLKVVETTNEIETPEEFMVVICMAIDEFSATHKGVSATEIAKTIYENVTAVNEMLGEYNK